LHHNKVISFEYKKVLDISGSDRIDGPDDFKRDMAAHSTFDSILGWTGLLRDNRCDEEAGAYLE
jgi:hypothetical protein